MPVRQPDGIAGPLGSESGTSCGGLVALVSQAAKAIPAVRLAAALGEGAAASQAAGLTGRGV
jgi:hypothetical protein